jgi:hypothetical protein
MCPETAHPGPISRSVEVMTKIVRCTRDVLVLHRPQARIRGAITASIASGMRQGREFGPKKGSIRLFYSVRPRSSAARIASLFANEHRPLWAAHGPSQVETESESRLHGAERNVEVNFLHHAPMREPGIRHRHACKAARQNDRCLGFAAPFRRAEKRCVGSRTGARRPLEPTSFPRASLPRERPSDLTSSHDLPPV